MRKFRWLKELLIMGFISEMVEDPLSVPCALSNGDFFFFTRPISCVLMAAPRLLHPPVLREKAEVTGIKGRREITQISDHGRRKPIDRVLRKGPPSPWRKGQKWAYGFRADGGVFASAARRELITGTRARTHMVFVSPIASAIHPERATPSPLS
jgi:hypothetical protein